MQKIELKNRKGQKIVGLLEMPGGEVHGACVVQHGYGGTTKEKHIQVMAQTFRDNGFVTFNFDTTNSFGESDGEYEDARLGLHAEDLEDVVQWVQKQEWFVEPLALTGHSMGGYAVTKYAEDYPDEVGFLAPIAPVVSGDLSFEACEEKEPGLLKKWKEDGWSISVSETTGRTKKKPWAQMEEQLNHDLLPQAQKITMPTLLIVGTCDTSCRLQDVKKLYEALPQNPKNKFVEIDAAEHVYRTSEHLDVLRDAIDRWLKSVL